MKTLLPLFITLFSVTLVFAQDLKVNYSSTAPTCDGIIDENDPWNNDNWIELGNLYQGSITDNLFAQFQFLHSNESIYIAIKIEDATYGTHPNSWERDCSELVFLMDTTVFEYQEPDSNFFKLRSQRVKDEENLTNGYHNGTRNVSMLIESENFQFATTDNGSAYFQEFRFNKEYLLKNTAFDGKFFRFDARVFDNSGTVRTGHRAWIMDEDYSYYMLNQTGIVQLLTGSETTNSIDQNKLEESIHVKNNELILKNIVGNVAIYNLHGQTVLKTTVKENTSIDISAIDAGVYIFKGGKLSTKFIKE